MRPFTCDSADAIAVDGVGAINGVPWPLGSVPIFLHGKDAVHGSGAVAVSCKRTLKCDTCQLLDGQYRWPVQVKLAEFKLTEYQSNATG